MYRLKQGGPQQQQQQRKRKAGGAGGGEPGAEAPARPVAAPQIEAVLEGMPKWELLREVMLEVQAERRRLRQLAGTSGSSGPGGAGAAAAAAAAAAGDSEADVIVLDGDDDWGGTEGPGGREQRGAADAAAAAQQAAEAPVLVVCQDTFTAGQVRQLPIQAEPSGLAACSETAKCRMLCHARKGTVQLPCNAGVKDRGPDRWPRPARLPLIAAFLVLPCSCERC